jgi:hypothetical protein
MYVLRLYSIQKWPLGSQNKLDTICDKNAEKSVAEYGAVSIAHFSILPGSSLADIYSFLLHLIVIQSDLMFL